MNGFPMTYQNIAGGALAEQVNAKLKDVLDNIDDPNTPAKAKRELNIKITFAPNEDRDRFDLTAAVATKLAGLKTIESSAFLVNQRGERIAYEREDPRQNVLFPEDDAINTRVPRATASPVLKETTKQ